MLEMTWVFSLVGARAEIVREETGFILNENIKPPDTYGVLPGTYSYRAVARNVGSTVSTIWVALVQNYRVLKVVSGSVPSGGTVVLEGSVILNEGEVSSYVFYAGHGTPPAEGQMIYVSGYDDYYGYWTLDARKWRIPLWMWVFIPLGVLVIAYGLYTLSRR